ncbi:MULTISPECIES: phosphohistidine phosphatase SixA [Aphanothece]|uniref:phosphohistidine phosphatase SixA n=1 Tax=Aphanothece TaxID=1121 RepID=UPI0039852BD2
MAELLLLRHGIAAERRPDHPDQARALTPEGRQRTAAVLSQLHRLGVGADRLLSSPLVRARQTAELAVAAGLAPAVTLTDALAPGGDPLPLLADLAAGGRLLLVGHEPDLGDLAARLIGAPPGSIALKKAGLAVLDLPTPRTPGQACLRLLLAPRQLLGGN